MNLHTRYCVGFALDDDDRVALIRKNRPEWQAGRLNGIGGHIELNERPWDAMEREFLEETGVRVTGWGLICTLIYPNAYIYVYRARITPEKLEQVRSMTDESVDIFHPEECHLKSYQMIPNLPWLLTLAKFHADSYDPFVIHVNGLEKGSPV